MNKSFWKFFAGFVILVVMVMGASETAYASESDDEETPAETIIFDEEEDLDGDISDFFVPDYELPEGLRDKVGQGEPAEQQVIWEPKYEWEFDLITGTVDEETSFSNLFWNQEYEKDFDGYIYGQETCPNFYIGLESRMAEVGCELAAVYNVLRFYDYSVNISDIIYEAEQNGYIMNNGAYGTNPFKLNMLLKAFDFSKRLKINQYKDYKVFSGQVGTSTSNDCIYIASFWNKLMNPRAGLHTVAFYKKAGENKLFALNFNTGEFSESVFTDISGICKKSTFVVGYMIVKLGK